MKQKQDVEYWDNITLYYEAALYLTRYGSVEKINKHINKKLTKRECNVLKEMGVKLNKITSVDFAPFMKIILDRVIKKERKEMSDPDNDGRSKINRKKRKRTNENLFSRN